MIDGDEVQRRTSFFSAPTLISRLSHSLPLLLGDVIFTGTPSGVGLGRIPPRYVAPGEVLVSHIEGIGKLRNRFGAATEA